MESEFATLPLCQDVDAVRRRIEKGEEPFRLGDGVKITVNYYEAGPEVLGCIGIRYGKGSRIGGGVCVVPVSGAELAGDENSEVGG